MATTPMDITAEVRGADPADPDGTSPSYAARWRSPPPTARSSPSPSTRRIPQACTEAVDAILDADWVVLGPGSWFTSVIPHLMVPGLRQALVDTVGRLVVVLNLEPQEGETPGFGPEDHLAALFEHAPDLKIHAVLVVSAKKNSATRRSLSGYG